jgi:hypothetical protein
MTHLITEPSLIKLSLSELTGRFTSFTSLMGIKLDMSKAYNRVEWEFVETVMRRMGLTKTWIKLVMP